MPSGPESLDIYIEELGEFPVLGAEEEIELVRKTIDGDSLARGKLISHNTRFVVAVAKKYVASGVPLEDLIQAGNLGLTIAADNFDPSRGFKFISFAVFRIREQIFDCMENHRSTIRIPAEARNLLVKIKKLRKKELEEFGKLPSDESVAKSMNTTVERVRQLDLASSTSSLDEIFSGDGKDSRYDFVSDESIPNPEDFLLQKERGEVLFGVRDVVLEALKDLPIRKWDERTRKRNIEMFIEYFGLDGNSKQPTFKELGERHGITRQAVSQIFAKLLFSLRTNKEFSEKITSARQHFQEPLTP